MKRTRDFFTEYLPGVSDQPVYKPRSDGLLEDESGIVYDPVTLDKRADAPSDDLKELRKRYPGLPDDVLNRDYLPILKAEKLGEQGIKLIRRKKPKR